MRAGIIVYLLIFSFSLILSGCVSNPPASSSAYSLDSNYRVSFSARGPISSNDTQLTSDVPSTIETKVRFSAGNGTFTGLLWVPEGGAAVKPALIYFPGAGVGKEVGREYARLLSPHGIAVFAVDQPGVGESSGSQDGIDADFSAFSSGGWPSWYGYLYGAVRAFDLLSGREGINSSDIMIAGESNGGRVAIIAAGIEPRLKGVLGISTAGYGRPAMQGANETAFVRSIDPDSYVLAITPRPAFFIHSSKDPVIPISDALRTFSLSGQPKDIAQVGCANHGYCAEMDAAIVNYSTSILGVR